MQRGDSILIDLIDKLKYWHWISGIVASIGSKMPGTANISSEMCCRIDRMDNEQPIQYHCLSCGRFLCTNCVRGIRSGAILGSEKEDGRVNIKCCKFCADASARTDNRKKNCEKVHPRDSPEPPSPCFSGSEKVDALMNIKSGQRDCVDQYLKTEDQVHSPHGSSVTDFSAHPSPVSIQCSPNRCRSDEEEADCSRKHFHSPSSESFRDFSDIDIRNFSFRHDFYSFQSAASTPSDSPSRKHFTSNRGGHFVQHKQEASPISRDEGPLSQEETTAVLKRPGVGIEEAESTEYCSDDLSSFRNQYGRSQKPLDFENNDLIWYPPLPNDEKDEMDGNYFEFDDDEDDYVGDSGAVFTPSSSLSCNFSGKEKQKGSNKEPLRALVQRHFRALVSQLLYGEDIKIGQENKPEEWVDIVASLAWQAANFVKPDTTRGGSMDPCDYVKVKCLATGSPNESALVKGVVCTKNVKHKRMTSQFKTPRVLILGGALEYQRVPNQLASFDTLLQQEIDHLKLIISKIEALHPNVLLVEKSVSSYAQEYLLAKEISLVLNVKRPLLERISRCTGAPITPSTDGITTARLGHCELFKLERVAEEHELNNQSSRKPSKTLMYFEGCPRRLGCTVLLKGACREELKKVKHVVQYAVFAAYHLSLETSFIADEGATLPEMPSNPSISSLEMTASEKNHTSVVSAFSGQGIPEELTGADSHEEDCPTDSELIDPRVACLVSEAYDGDVVAADSLDSKNSDVLPSETRIPPQHGVSETMGHDGENEGQGEYFSSTDTNQSILVSFSSRCVLKRIVCERSRLLRIKFYGCFDKPLGRYLRDDLFDQTSYCRFCKEPAEAHVLCYTHRQGNLTVNVKRIPSLRLPGEQDGKIWMWHRCLKCTHDANGVPPATRRVVMSDAAWGLSFGKFLELSFSNHATANRVATCGHSLQRDCLRYYGYGNMVAFFRYSPIDILSVCLPPSMIKFNGNVQQEWLRKEAGKLMDKVEALYLEISGVLDGVEQKSSISGHEFAVARELLNYIMELKDLLKKERTDYNDLLKPPVSDSSQPGQIAINILELNRLQHSLVVGFHVWDRRLYSLDLLLETSSPKAKRGSPLCTKLKELNNSEADVSEPLDLMGSSMSGSLMDNKEDLDSVSDTMTSSEEPNLSERIDSAWTGSDHLSLADCSVGGSLGQMGGNDSPPPYRRLMAPARVHSFDSALKIRDRTLRGVPSSSLHLSTIRSFHASGDYRNMVRDPVSSMTRTYSQVLPRDAQKSPSMISGGADLLGARLLLPHTGNDIVIAVYDDEPTSVISYALSSKEHEDWISAKPDEYGNDWNSREVNREDMASGFSSLHSFSTVDIDQVNSYSNYCEDTMSSSSSVGSLFRDPKRSPHLRISFEDESSPSSGGKAKFSVTCYFGKQFESLRRKCCPSELDFVRSLSRCKRWSAQGGKSNVYFAKSMDERFIIKQVTKTELDSFEDFASEYFKYLDDSLGSGSPTCLAKVLGLYQVTVKHTRGGGKETKMDVMVIENLFFERRISRVYDLKGSNRARYNPDTTGKDKVLLDMNLVESLRTKPMFLGSKAKRSLERAVWNDTSFLASVDVMDYSLLVGVDDESKELVLGIIDFMRQYTWDKHLETWVKASGILGGPKNASPTIVSPKQYKKRFRKAMTAYFLTVPDQWSSSSGAADMHCN